MAAKGPLGSNPSHRTAALLTTLYVAALATILLWPTPVDKPIDGTLNRTLHWFHEHGAPHWLFTYYQVQFVANIALFVPLGIILALLLPRRNSWLSIPIAAAMSVLVELIQGTFLPHRVADPRDVLANTSGAIIGFIVVIAWRKLRVSRATLKSP